MKNKYHQPDFGQKLPRAYAVDRGKYVDVKNVPLFSINNKKVDEKTGKRIPITHQDLRDTVANFWDEKKRFGYLPPVKKDHLTEGEQISLLDGVKKIGGWIFGTLKGIEKKFYEEVILKGKLAYRSSEYIPSSRKLSAVALLGAVPPEIKMPPLNEDTILSYSVLCFSEEIQKETILNFGKWYNGKILTGNGGANKSKRNFSEGRKKVKGKLNFGFRYAARDKKSDEPGTDTVVMANTKPEMSAMGYFETVGESETNYTEMEYSEFTRKFGTTLQKGEVKMGNFSSRAKSLNFQGETGEKAKIAPEELLFTLLGEVDEEHKKDFMKRYEMEDEKKEDYEEDDEDEKDFEDEDDDEGEEYEEDEDEKEYSQGEPVYRYRATEKGKLMFLEGFVDKGGAFHPIRDSGGYNDSKPEKGGSKSQPGVPKGGRKGSKTAPQGGSAKKKKKKKSKKKKGYRQEQTVQTYGISSRMSRLEKENKALKERFVEMDSDIRDTDYESCVAAIAKDYSIDTVKVLKFGEGKSPQERADILNFVKESSEELPFDTYHDKPITAGAGGRGAKSRNMELAQERADEKGILFHAAYDELLNEGKLTF